MPPRLMAWLLGGWLLAPLQAADKPPVDADLLEFLGSIDGAGEGWSEYLENTDPRRISPPAKPPAPRPPPPPAEDKS